MTTCPDCHIRLNDEAMHTCPVRQLLQTSPAFGGPAARVQLSAIAALVAAIQRETNYQNTVCTCGNVGMICH